MPPELAVKPNVWVENLAGTFPGRQFIRQTLAVTECEVRKVLHEPLEPILQSLQPVLWMVIFGPVFSRVSDIPTGGIRYADFIAPGILAQSVLFLSVVYGVMILWERDLGILHKFLVSPAARMALVLGKALSAGVRVAPQIVVVYVLSLLLSIHLRWNPLAILGVIVAVVMAAAFFSALSLVAACLAKTRERFMGINRMMTLPFFFASNAIFPLAMMPGWLRIFSRMNPLSYLVDALRTLMLPSWHSEFGLLLDFGVLAIGLAVLLAILSRLYPQLVY